MRHSHAYREIAHTDDACAIILLYAHIQSFLLTRCQPTYFQQVTGQNLMSSELTAKMVLETLAAVEKAGEGGEVTVQSAE